MNISIITKKLKLILSEKKLNKLGKETEFTQRERNVSAFQLVTAMICALGDKNTEYLSDILRYFNSLTRGNCLRLYNRGSNSRQWLTLQQTILLLNQAEKGMCRRLLSSQELLM